MSERYFVAKTTSHGYGLSKARLRDYEGTADFTEAEILFIRNANAAKAAADALIQSRIKK